MEFVVHHRYRGPALCGRVNLPYGTKLRREGDYLFTRDGRPVCVDRSETAKRHFAPNGDGRGLERGALTYAIAYGPCREAEGFRFSDAQRELLCRDWGKFLRQDVEAVLFNDSFFGAPAEELQAMADALQIKIRRQA